MLSDANPTEILYITKRLLGDLAPSSLFYELYEDIIISSDLVTILQ